MSGGGMSILSSITPTGWASAVGQRLCRAAYTVPPSKEKALGDGFWSQEALPPQRSPKSTYSLFLVL